MNFVSQQNFRIRCADKYNLGTKKREVLYYYVFFYWITNISDDGDRAYNVDWESKSLPHQFSTEGDAQVFINIKIEDINDNIKSILELKGE